jgi:hypothetical protein
VPHVTPLLAESIKRESSWRACLNSIPRCGFPISRGCLRYAEQRISRDGQRHCEKRGSRNDYVSAERNGAYLTGRYTAEAKAERRQVRMLIRELRHLTDSGE